MDGSKQKSHGKKKTGNTWQSFWSEKVVVHHNTEEDTDLVLYFGTFFVCIFGTFYCISVPYLNRIDAERFLHGSRSSVIISDYFKNAFDSCGWISVTNPGQAQALSSAV